MHRLVIGDIHGCHDELLALLDLAGLGAGDEIVAVGDLVGRGPATGDVLRFFGAPVDEDSGRDGPTDGKPGAEDRKAGRPAIARPPCPTRSVMGNHERKHLLVRAGEIEAQLSVRLVRQELGEAAWRRACDWMDGLPPLIELPEALVIHALWEPGVPQREQRPEMLVGAGEAEAELKRRLGDRPWYDLYDGPRPLICGHHDYGRTRTPLVVGDRLFGIDTGCVYGGDLTGLLLPEFRFLSVRSRRDWWGEIRSHHGGGT